MSFTRKFAVFLAGLGLTIAAPDEAAAQKSWTFQPVVTDLDTPWGVAPLPEGGARITERESFAKSLPTDGGIYEQDFYPPWPIA